MRALGADVLEIPAIRTVKIQENERFHHALSRLYKYQWIVFTSPTGVRIFFEEMAACRIDHRSLFEVHFAVIGSGTKKELEKRGFYPDLMPEIYDGEHLGLALAEACEGSERIMIPRAAIGSQELTAALDEKQLSYDDIATYDTEYENGGCIDLGAELDSIDYVVFTSASTVRGFAAAAGQKDLSLVKAVCIGKQTKAAADALGMQTYVAPKPSIDSLVERLVEVHSADKQ
jgi:uroporphyrinogen III methyltransferase/synthase